MSESPSKLPDEGPPIPLGGGEAAPIQRLVVKVGTSTLTDRHGRIDRAFIADLTAQLAAQRMQGRDVLLVTSGAIRAGREARNELRKLSHQMRGSGRTYGFSQATRIYRAEPHWSRKQTENQYGTIPCPVGRRSL